MSLTGDAGEFLLDLGLLLLCASLHMPQTIGLPVKAFWCIPNSDFCGQLPCRGLFFLLFLSLTFVKKHDFEWFSKIFHTNYLNLLSTRETTYKTGILDPIEFWLVININP